MNKEILFIKGAREHNLKNIDLEIPRNKLVVITGLSGSGKSSLAFDTIYAEGQRRYVESLSAYARQFLGQMEKPDVDYIEGLSPAIAIQQRAPSHNPRSTVGTVTEIYDYLRLLFARIGKAYCYQCGREIVKQSSDQIVDRILAFPSGEKINVLAPLVRGRKGEYRSQLEQAKKEGFVRVRIDNEIYDINEEIKLEKNKKHTIEILVDRLVLKENIRSRLTDSIETALKIGKGIVTVSANKKDHVFSEQFACVKCGISLAEFTPRMFSFNNPYGACEVCSGLGTKMEVDPKLIVPEPSLSLRKGAIYPWSSPNAFYYHDMIKNAAQRYGISMDAPFSKLSKEHQNIMLYGGEGFEGVIPNLERRFKETESEYVRNEILGSYMNVTTCHACKGARLKPQSLAVKVGGKSIYEVTLLPIKECLKFFESIKLNPKETLIAKQVFKEIILRLKFLCNVGLDYLTLERTSGTLSGGEAQRIHLATQIGSSLVGVLYVLDEPSIGLHQRDNTKLLATLKALRDLGNTVIVVEHDEETMLNADYLIDLGPGAGIHGGQVIAAGTVKEVMKSKNSITALYLRKDKIIPVPRLRRKQTGRFLEIKGARKNNLKNIDIKIPLGIFTCITGVSGSGKSSLVAETLYPAMMHYLYHSSHAADGCRELTGYQHIDKIIDIDQSPIGRTPRSNPATYTGVFTHIRDLFSNIPFAKMRGYKPGRFSFNVRGGRCEACAGDGVIKIEMHFLPDVYVPCEVCKGKRYNRESLEVLYKGKNIADVLDMRVEEALEFFKNIPNIYNVLKTLDEVGLGYIKLGQSATTLSGGEAQRIKLSSELARRSTGKTLYILDEPTTGLHFADISKLLDVLSKLTDAGNTVIVIEHNLDVVKTADYIIDLGPEGGEDGGYIVVEGTPEEIIKNKSSYTGQFLRKALS